MIKKCLAFLLATVLVIGVLPLEVLANDGPASGSPVTNFGQRGHFATITSGDASYPPATGNLYNIVFTWSQPSAPFPGTSPDEDAWRPPEGFANPDGSIPSNASPFDNSFLANTHVGGSNNSVDTFLPPSSWSRYPTEYRIELFNRTTGVRYPNIYIPWNELVAAAGGASVLNTRGELPPGQTITLDRYVALTPGSLVEINIIPVHRVPVWTPNIIGGEPVAAWTFRVAELAPLDPHPDAAHRGMVFMTDIHFADAFVSEGAIIADWQNPTWFGDSFPYWQVTVHHSTTGAELMPRIAPVPTTQLTTLNISGRNMLRHSVSHPNMQIGNSYFIRVEPMRSSNPVDLVRRGGNEGAIILLPPTADLAARTTFSFAARPLVHQYRSPSRILTPSLSLMEDGDGSLRLHWTSIASGAADQVIIEWWEMPFPAVDPPPQALSPTGTIAVLDGPHATSVNWWPLGQITPIRPLGFTLRIYNDGEFLGRTNMEIFTPGIADFTPFSPLIRRLEPILSPEYRFQALRIQWRAFTRTPFTDDERDRLVNPIYPHFRFSNMLPGANYVDMNMRYRIFISDSMEHLTVGWPTEDGLRHLPLFAPIVSDITPSAGMLLPTSAFPVEQGIPQDMPYFQFDNLTQYTTRDANGNWVTRPMTANNVYFVRIEAIRPHPGGDAFVPFVSVPAFDVIFIPPDDDIITRPGMMDAPPMRARVNNPDEPVQIILDWDIRYVEIFDPTSAAEGLNQWFASVGYDPRTGSLFYGRRGRHMPVYPEPNGLRGWASINAMLDPVTANNVRNRNVVFDTAFQAEIHRQMRAAERLGFDGIVDFPLRVQDLYHAHYRIHVVEYDVMMAGFDTLADAFYEYREILMRPASNNQWVHIGRPTPNDNGVFSHAITSFPGIGTLAPNTTYVIFFQPYEPRLGADGFAFFPNYVVVTTPDEFVPAQPRPTTPILHPATPITYHSLRVRWRVQGDGVDIHGHLPPFADRTMHFEIVISETLVGYPNPVGAGRRFYTWQEMYDAGHLTMQIMPDGVPYYFFTFTDLFPDTMYYIWIRAINPELEPNEGTSDWSNPIQMRTLIMPPPQPPRIGLANRVHLNAHNIANNTTYEPIEPNALSIFVNRTFSDYRYHELPRAAGGVVTGGPAALINLQNLDAVYAIRFSELVANRHYYIRARTILTLSRTAPARVYSYEIQLADNADFLDPVIFIIPPLAVLDPINMRRAYSSWVDMGVTTGVSDDDFDGVFRPEQFPLPDYDFEITYRDGTLQWRFRTNRIGADGRPDQQVDQRFISRLIDSRVHRFEVDLSAYFRSPDWPVRERELVMPLSILRAFNERLITLVINFGDLTVDIPPGAFDTAAVRNLGMGIGSYVRINMRVNETGDGLPSLALNNHFTSLPQQLRISAETPQRTLVMTDFARPLPVRMHLHDIMQPGGMMRTGLFYTTPQLGAWQDTAGMSGSVRTPATFAGISREMPNVPPTVPAQHPAMAAMERVSARMTFTDLFEFNPGAPVHTAAFNNIMNALANNQRSVTLNAPLSAAASQSLDRGRFLATGNLTYEAAVDILVRFYELRTRQVINPMSSPQMVIGIANATPALHQSLLKAADIGFITGPINPHAPLTLGELMMMLDIILTDTGF